MKRAGRAPLAILFEGIVMSDRIGFTRSWPGLLPSRRCRPDLQVAQRREALRTNIFRMTQLHQWLDEQIRAQTDRHVSNPLDMFRLRRLRLIVKNRLHDLSMTPSPS